MLSVATRAILAVERLLRRYYIVAVHVTKLGTRDNAARDRCPHSRETKCAAERQGECRVFTVNFNFVMLGNAIARFY